MKAKIFLTFFLLLTLISFVSATSDVDYGSSNFNKYNGVGTYSMFPGDEVSLEGGYLLKYVNYQKDASWNRFQQLVNGNVAHLGLYNGEIDTTDYSKNQVYSFDTTDIDTEAINTFSSGFYFNVEILEKDSKEVKIKITTGILSVCHDTDAGEKYQYTEDTWGLNYNERGKASETVDTIDGQTKNEGEDACLNSIKIKEYFCYKDRLNSTETYCPDIGSCEEGICISVSFFQKISNWFKKLFD